MPVKKIIIFLFLAILLGTGATYYFLHKNKSLPPVAKNSISENNNLSKFADFIEKKVIITPVIPDYKINTAHLENFGAIQNAAGKKFSEKEIKALENNGFFITPGENILADGEKIIDVNINLSDEFILDYKKISGDWAPSSRKPENTVFITSDLLLHLFHVYLDRTFQDIEQSQFQPKLSQLSDQLFQESLKQYQSSSDKQKDSFQRLATFFLIPKVILETTGDDQNDSDNTSAIMAKLASYQKQIPIEIWQPAKEELELIQKADGFTDSPLFGKYLDNQPQDYTQFKPRSHYVKNSLLRSYWKAMIWYGRTGFLTKSPELTLDAINQTLLLVSQNNLTLWENIYLPTVFFVGQSDDLSYFDYLPIINKIYGQNPDFAEITNPDKFSQFQQEVGKLAGPQIQSSIVVISPGEKDKQKVLQETKSFRFMGQRFTPDSLIFSQLTQGDEAPDPATGQKLPAIPTALMVMDIFGSQQANVYLQNWIKENAPQSDKVIVQKMKPLQENFNSLTPDFWTQNLYWSWLYTLKSLFNPFGKGYPEFMRNQAWQDKSLNTALGSWTELRHDTLLYAKQSYAEFGAGGDEENIPPVPKGYVEPNLVFLNRIIALAEMTKTGLEKNNVLSPEQKDKLEKLTEGYNFYREIVKKELQNQQITDEEFEKLRTSVPLLNFAITPPNSNGPLLKSSEIRAGVIADVHTAITSQTQEILYEATGIPSAIYVAVSDVNGTRLTQGIIYSYYEFTQPFGERLSDEKWQANIYENSQNFPTPKSPFWFEKLVD